jgi:hypothetical protein
MAASRENLTKKLVHYFETAAQLSFEAPEHTEESLAALSDADLRSLYERIFESLPQVPVLNRPARPIKRTRCDY